MEAERQSGPEFDLEAAADQAIAACGGDLRAPSSARPCATGNQTAGSGVLAFGADAFALIPPQGQYVSRLDVGLERCRGI